MIRCFSGWVSRSCGSPFDPYGGIVHWSSLAQPMWVAMQNPPLCSYYIAAIGSFAGFGEVAMHSAFLLPAIAAVLGTFALAKRLCRSPLTAAFLTLFTPVFLISASHVMCDVMLLAFWIWAIHFWIAGLDRGKWHSASGLCGSHHRRNADQIFRDQSCSPAPGLHVDAGAPNSSSPQLPDDSSPRRSRLRADHQGEIRTRSF